MSYEANKRWRQNNPTLRAAQTKRNYDQGTVTRVRKRRIWSLEDDTLILTNKDGTEDRELAKELKCSVQAIQVRRSRLLKKLAKENATTQPPGS